MDAVCAALAKLELTSFEDALLDSLVDKGFAEHVTASVLASTLREIGLRGAQVLQVRKLALLPAVPASIDSVCCMR